MVVTERNIRNVTLCVQFLICYFIHLLNGKLDFLDNRAWKSRPLRPCRLRNLLCVNICLLYITDVSNGIYRRRENSMSHWYSIRQWLALWWIFTCRVISYVCLRHFPIILPGAGGTTNDTDSVILFYITLNNLWKNNRPTQRKHIISVQENVAYLYRPHILFLRKLKTVSKTLNQPFYRFQ
jgi:hypothetical protein